MAITTTRPAVRELLNKVPEITIWFWIIKVLATTVGETAADFLSDTLQLGLTNTIYLTASLLVVALAVPDPVPALRPDPLLDRPWC